MQKYGVYAHYDDTVVLLATFDDEREAEFIAEQPYFLEYADGEKDVIYPDEMWVGEYNPLPFEDLPDPREVSVAYETDELPF